MYFAGPPPIRRNNHFGTCLGDLRPKASLSHCHSHASKRFVISDVVDARRSGQGGDGSGRRVVDVNRREEVSAVAGNRKQAAAGHVNGVDCGLRVRRIEAAEAQETPRPPPALKRSVSRSPFIMLWSDTQLIDNRESSSSQPSPPSRYMKVIDSWRYVAAPAASAASTRTRDPSVRSRSFSFQAPFQRIRTIGGIFVREVDDCFAPRDGGLHCLGIEQINGHRLSPSDRSSVAFSSPRAVPRTSCPASTSACTVGRPRTPVAPATRSS